MARKAKTAGEEADALILKAAKGNTEDPVDPNDGLNLDDPAPDDDLLNLDEEIPQDDSLQDNSGMAQLQHKFDVLQGKYNAETERMNTMLSTVMQQVTDLKAENERLKANPSAPDADTGEDDLEKIKTEYPTLYKGLLAVARKEVKTSVQEATARSEEKVDGLLKKSAEKDRASYLEALTAEIPRWREINVHPTFIKWLEVKDRLSGRPKSELLLNAYNGMDVKTTAAFFLDFMQEKGIRNQGSKIASDEDIAPNDSGVNITGNRKGGFTITQPQIDKFYKDRAMGRFAGTPEEAAKFEARIFQAIREGKVK